jgi:flagellar hook-basal body complex protein FliE
MHIDPIPPVGVLPEIGTRPPHVTSFADAMGAAADALTSALSRADTLAGEVASGKGSIADAAIARAKADVMLEVAAIAASRVSGTISVLLQTQA